MEGLEGTITTGDITRKGLGLGPEVNREAITEVWHLAAVYDLEVSKDMASSVNIGGTENVLDFCAGLPSLDRLFYVSTCYVSGWFRGTFRETDLDVGQSFKNHYEWSKFKAEMAVRERMEEIPTTIFRPSIVVGDSESGETAKFDGPYHIMESMKRMPPWFLFLKVGSGIVPVNLIPVDFVIRAMVFLSGIQSSSGKTYHVADPAPLTVFEVEKLLATCLNRSFLYLPIPYRWAKGLLSVRPVAKLFAIPPQAIDYFVHNVNYDTEQLIADLEGSSISCPPFPSYVERITGFFVQNRKNVNWGAMT